MDVDEHISVVVNLSTGSPEMHVGKRYLPNSLITARNGAKCDWSLNMNCMRGSLA